MLFLLLLNIELIFGLFAGNGLKTWAKSLDGTITVTDCLDYDQCYNTLCDYSFLPVYWVEVRPYAWKNNCSYLDPTDDRYLSSEIDIYNSDGYLGYYETTTVSDASILLCALGKNKSITMIEFTGYGC